MMRKFRSRLLILFSSLAAGTLLVSLLAVTIATDNQSERTIERELQVSERVFDELLDVRGQQLFQAAQVLTDDFGFREAVASGDEATIISALINHGERIGTDLMVLQTPSGAEIAATHPLQSLPPLAQLTATQRVGLLRIEARIYQLVTVPVMAPDLIAWATFGFAIDDALARLLRQLTNADITFMDFAERTVFASSLTPPQQQRLKASELSEQGFERWLASEQFAARRITLQQHRLGYHEPANQLLIVLSSDRTVVTAEFTLLQKQYIGIGLATLLVAVLLAGITARKINQPLVRLT